MKNNTLMIILTVIIIGIASFGKYVEVNITESATSILENRLKPAPMISHIFDYYGTTLQDALTSSNTNIQNIQEQRENILLEKVKRDTLWSQYTSTYLVDSEAEMVKKVNLEMDELDKTVDFILTSSDTVKIKSIITSDKFNADINTAMNDLNWLIDIQTQVGQEETVKMIVLLGNFSNFMIGTLSLAIIMLGSIIYSVLKKDEPIKNTRARKNTTTKRKIPVKTPAKTPIKTPVKTPKKNTK
jgi:hypothetical protein